MSNIVRVEYDEIWAIIKLYHTYTDDIAKIKSTTTMKVNALRTEWIGDAATQFFNEMDSRLLPGLDKVIYALDMCHIQLRQIIRIISEADAECARYFRHGNFENNFG